MTTSRSADATQGPELEVTQAGVASRAGVGVWDVAFGIVNRGGGPVSLLAAWLPHGKFHADEQSLEGTPPLAKADRTELAFRVAFDEQPGTKVENCFVIFRVDYHGETWRVLARYTVVAGRDGSPQARPESVTTHRVGFSE